MHEAGPRPTRLVEWEHLSSNCKMLGMLNGAVSRGDVGFPVERLEGLKPKEIRMSLRADGAARRRARVCPGVCGLDDVRDVQQRRCSITCLGEG